MLLMADSVPPPPPAALGDNKPLLPPPPIAPPPTRPALPGESEVGGANAGLGEAGSEMEEVGERRGK